MKRFTSERVVVTWNGPVAGAAHEAEGGYRKAVAELYHDLIEQFEHIDLLQFSAGKCVMRTVVMEGEDLLVIRERICAALSERGIDNATVGVVDVDNGTPLTDQLRQYATLSEDTAFTDAADEIEKSRALIKRLRQQLRKASRYKAAATALWQLLDDIDAADDAAREDDARYRATARTIAKRRSEHAVSFDGQTLVWSWDSPLPAADFAKLEVKVLQGEATDDEIAEYKRLVALHEPSPELPPELLDLAANQIKAGMHGPAPTFLERIGATFLERIGEAAKAKTQPAHCPEGVPTCRACNWFKSCEVMPDYYKTERRLIEVQPEKYSAADCIKVPPGGPGAIALNEAMAGVHPSLADDGFEPYRGPINEHTTDEEKVRWSPPPCESCSSEAGTLLHRYASGVLSSDDFCDIVGVCSCGAPVADYTANEGLYNARPNAELEDYWVACMNVECEHHEGEGWNQGTIHEWYEELPTKGPDAFVHANPFYPGQPIYNPKGEQVGVTGGGDVATCTDDSPIVQYGGEDCNSEADDG
jgi:hypothetical protein